VIVCHGPRCHRATTAIDAGARWVTLVSQGRGVRACSAACLAAIAEQLAVVDQLDRTPPAIVGTEAGR
jgi:hypothetical protein